MFTTWDNILEELGFQSKNGQTSVLPFKSMASKILKM